MVTAAAVAAAAAAAVVVAAVVVAAAAVVVVVVVVVIVVVTVVVIVLIVVVVDAAVDGAATATAKTILALSLRFLAYRRLSRAFGWARFESRRKKPPRWLASDSASLYPVEPRRRDGGKPGRGGAITTATLLASSTRSENASRLWHAKKIVDWPQLLRGGGVAAGARLQVMMIERRERLRRRGSRIVRRVLRSYRKAQRGRPGRTLVSRQRVRRQTLRAEHRRTVAMAHRRSVKMILRMIRLVKTRLTLVSGRHALYDSVAERVRRCHPLLLLPSVTEPHPDHFFLQLKVVRERGDLLRGRFRLFVEVLLERALHRHLDRRSLLSFPALGGDFVDARRRAGRRVRLLEPLLQQRLQLAHVLEAQLKSLEPAYRRLREDVAVESTERETDVRLGEAQLDAPLFELSSERLEVVRCRCVLLSGALIPVVRVAGMQRVADRRPGIPQVRM